MSAEANPKGKGGKATASANNDADSIMPLLFATIGNPSISFKKMAAMDELGRTESSLEHKFRKWRQKGREIAAENPDNAGTLGTTSATNTPKKPRAPSKKGDNGNGKGKGPGKQANVRDGHDEADEGAGMIKQEPDEMAAIGDEMLNPSIKGKATAIGGAKKRAASEAVAAAERQGSEAPAKKAKVMKKGIAKVVKKAANTKAYSGSDEEDSVREDKEEVAIKPKGKGNVNVATTKAKGKAKKGKAGVAAKAGQIPSHLDEDADADMDGEDALKDGMIDMQFETA